MSVVHYQVLLYLDKHDTDTIVINKLFKLNFMYFTMYLDMYQQHGYQGLF